MKHTPVKFKPAIRRINWGDELLHTLEIAGKILLKTLTCIVNVVLTVLLIGILTGIVAGTAFAVYIKNHIDPQIDETLFMSGGTSQTTKLYYYDYTDRTNRIGEAVELEDQRLYGTENSLWAPLADIPDHLKDAFISIEDKRFEDHKGVDWIRSLKAVARRLFSPESKRRPTEKILATFRLPIFSAELIKSMVLKECA